MTSRKLTICVDVDDVCLDMVPEWLRRYNAEYGDTLTQDDLLTWDVSSITKAGRDFYKYLRQPDLYDRVCPRLGAKPAIETFRSWGHRVLFVSSCVDLFMAQQKLDCLERWGFLTDWNEFIPTTHKYLIRGDVLIDDNASNIADFPGCGLLVDQPWNRQQTVGLARLGGLGEAPAWIAKHFT